MFIGYSARNFLLTGVVQLQEQNYLITESLNNFTVILNKLAAKLVSFKRVKISGLYQSPGCFAYSIPKSFVRF